MTSQMFTRILVAVDDSPAGPAAVHAAVDLAVLNGGRIRFVHVIGTAISSTHCRGSDTTGN
jgi:nucleotide-binding universal stress UspA family protein